MVSPVCSSDFSNKCVSAKCSSCYDSQVKKCKGCKQKPKKKEKKINFRNGCKLFSVPGKGSRHRVPPGTETIPLSSLRAVPPWPGESSGPSVWMTNPTNSDDDGDGKVFA